MSSLLAHVHEDEISKVSKQKLAKIGQYQLLIMKELRGAQLASDGEEPESQISEEIDDDGTFDKKEKVAKQNQVQVQKMHYGHQKM